MYYTPRGIDEREQRIMDCLTAQKFLDVSVMHKDISVFFKFYNIKNIVIIGATHFGKCLASLLRQSDIQVNYFVDKMYFKYKQGVCNIPVISYEDITKSIEADMYVVTSNRYFNEMVDSLLERGIPLEKVASINDIVFGMDRIKK